jgi:hypothetical protein
LRRGRNDFRRRSRHIVVIKPTGDERRPELRLAGLVVVAHAVATAAFGRRGQGLIAQVSARVPEKEAWSQSSFRLTTHFRAAHQAIEVDETAMTRGAGDDRTHLAAGYSALAARSDHASGTLSCAAVSRNDVRVRPWMARLSCSRYMYGGLGRVRSEQNGKTAAQGGGGAEQGITAQRLESLETLAKTAESGAEAETIVTRIHRLEKWMSWTSMPNARERAKSYTNATRRE